MVGRNEKASRAKIRNLIKRKNRNNETKIKRSVDHLQNKLEKVAVIDDKLARRISKLEAAMSNAVVDGETTVTKKKQKTRDAADGQAQEKSKKAENNDDTEGEKDNGQEVEKKKKKQEEEEKENQMG